MKKLSLTIILIFLPAIFLSNVQQSKNDLKIWKEFVEILKKGDFPQEKIRPYYETLKEPLLGFLKQMREKASWDEWEATPEIYRVENRVHFLIPLSFDGQKATYCFSFLVDGNNWYFQHLEAIIIRLDQISSLPTSKFPDLPEDQKMWFREENRVSRQVELFNFLAKEKGKEFAFHWFKDGAGYALAAKALVPFFPAPKAFILYLCWEQSNLRGNHVTLETLNDSLAVVRMEAIYFHLYSATAHLQPKISFRDYRKIFETIWLDRAKNGGWELQLKYEGKAVIFTFKKKISN